MPPTPTLLHFDDLKPGMRFDLGTETIDGDEMTAYAHRFDWQPIHTDPAAAAQTPFGGVIAPGMFVCSLFARMLTRGMLEHVAGAAVGSRIDEIRWHAPLRPGDTVHGVAVIGTVGVPQRNSGVVGVFGELCLDGAVVFDARFPVRLGRPKPQGGPSHE